MNSSSYHDAKFIVMESEPVPPWSPTLGYENLPLSGPHRGADSNVLIRVKSQQFDLSNLLTFCTAGLLYGWLLDFR